MGGNHLNEYNVIKKKIMGTPKRFFMKHLTEP